MQTFKGRVSLAQQKDTKQLFFKNVNFESSSEAENGSVGEQPLRNSLTDENEKAGAL